MIWRLSRPTPTCWAWRVAICAGWLALGAASMPGPAQNAGAMTVFTSSPSKGFSCVASATRHGATRSSWPCGATASTSGPPARPWGGRNSLSRPPDRRRAGHRRALGPFWPTQRPPMPPGRRGRGPFASMPRISYGNAPRRWPTCAIAAWRMIPSGPAAWATTPAICATPLGAGAWTAGPFGCPWAGPSPAKRAG